MPQGCRIHLPMQETQETCVQSLSRGDALKEETATHFSILMGKFHGQRSLAVYSPWGHKGDTGRAHTVLPGGEQAWSPEQLQKGRRHTGQGCECSQAQLPLSSISALPAAPPSEEADVPFLPFSAGSCSCPPRAGHITCVGKTE